MKRTVSLWVVSLLTAAEPALAASARLYSNPNSAPEAFAAAAIEQALRERGFSVTRRDGPDSSPLHDEALIYFDPLGKARAVIPGGVPALDETKIQAEGFSLRRQVRGNQHAIVIASRDAGGAMYGGLELAEQ